MSSIPTTWPFRDYDLLGERYVDIVVDPTHPNGVIKSYNRGIDKKTTPTECVICIEAENEMYTKYAHPKAHTEAHTRASKQAEALALKEKYTEEYIYYYIFFYGKEYKKIYKELYKQYRTEYYHIVINRPYPDAKICSYHEDSMRYLWEVEVYEATHPQEAGAQEAGYEDSPRRYDNYDPALITGPADCDGTPVSRF